MDVNQTFGPYSPVRQAGKLYFVSGQVGVTADREVSNDVAEQTKQALENLQSVLSSAELKMADVIKTVVFLKNMDDFAVVNEIYISYFMPPRPARSCVAIKDLPKVAKGELLIEIEAIAYKKGVE